MMSWKKRGPPPPLFHHRINKLEGFQNVIGDGKTAFISLDTEYCPVTRSNGGHRVIRQVGLAYIKAMLPEEAGQEDPTSFGHGWGSLRKYYDQNHVRGLTLDVHWSRQNIDNCIREIGKVPYSRPHRFGEEKQVDEEDLEANVIEFIESCCPVGTNIILVGFGMSVEWNFLTEISSKAMSRFSSWMDLKDIVADIGQVGEPPGRVLMLAILGYHRKDVEPGYYGPGPKRYADNAGDDTVSMLAMANSLLYVENQRKFRRRQELGQIARIFTMKQGAFLDPSIPRPFAATLRAGTGLLPDKFNSPMKLARRFLEFQPDLTGLLSAKTGYIAFTSQHHIDRFIAATDGRVVPTDDGPVTFSAGPAESHSPEVKAALEERSRVIIERQKIKEIRELDRLSNNMEDDIINLGDIFD